MLSKLNITLFWFSLLICSLCFANTDKYRLMINDDPSATMTIGFNAINGLSHKVFYGTVDHGTDITLYPNIQTVYKSFDNFRGMNTKFIKLTNLNPNTTYYFVISDDNSISQRFYFTTASDNPEDPISLVMGGDSRNNRDIRRNANKLVSKIKPDVVTFAGDMTNLATSEEWQDWFDDWQETIGPDGRMTPIIVAEGNHEKNVFSTVSYIERFFDAPVQGYYAIEFNSLLKIFTLNTEVSISGDQTTWLATELSSSWDMTWKIAQYHKPMRPHYSSKADGTLQYSNWADLFYNYQVRLVQESDIHLCKTTWPIRPTSENELGTDEGFIEDCLGTVFTGSGCWGAPLREPNDIKEWTRDTEGVNHFQWAIITKEKIDVRTVLVDNAEEVCYRVDGNPVDELPLNIELWNPSNGELIRINNTDYNEYAANFKADILKGEAPLTVNFEGFYSGCNDNSITPNYQWIFGDGNTDINTQTTSHTFENPGTYNVRLQMEIGTDIYFKETTITVTSPECIVSPIVINEIQFNPDSAMDTGDYIELYNPNNFGVDLSCYSLTSNSQSYILDNVFIPADSYFVVVENPNKFSSIYTNVTNISSYSTIDLDDTGDAISLLDAQGCLVDFVEFTISNPWPSSNDPYILNLIDPNLDNENGANWNISESSPGISNQKEVNSGVIVYVKAFLEGPYNPTTGLMQTALQSNNLLPLTQPYSSTNHNYTGNETASNFNTYVTDWVYLELRDFNDPNVIVDARAALIKNDGSILEVDSTNGVTFNNIEPGEYYIAVYHRSHLGVLSASPISLPNTEGSAFDFSIAKNQANGIDQQKELPTGRAALHCGDFDANGLINNIDYNYWGSSSAVINQYVTWDNDLNTLVNNLDYNNWDRNKSKVGILEIQK